MGLFGKEPQKTPKDQVREWRSKLRKETMALDRQIRNIQREEAKVKLSLKDAAKKGDRDSCVVLAKELVRSRKAINRINVSKAQINSVMLNMEQQLANIKIAGAIQRSTDLMKCMQNLVKVGEISATMQEMSREMMKAGIIEEMLEETIDEATGIDDDDMEEAVQSEVEKILFEVTAGAMGKAPEISTKEPTAKQSTSKVVEEKEEEDEEEITEMQKRLEALRS
ncbi:charged multivesicular body protein 3 isoform X2 [Tetranychus urticae]|uniref:Charged multivesicular body protein 3 n=1 Tax=Tetranychus urticae TaxID=32264 RepID=T1KNK0_TETUR|nr:charged multivesicular body protein 3 isoform X2 [Tetranychus urticae]